MSQPPVKPIQLTKVTTSVVKDTPDLLVVEEPLEIRLGFGPKSRREQRTLTTTFRTPGNDDELTTGLLFAEGIIQKATDILSIRRCVNKEDGSPDSNVLRVELAPYVAIDWSRLDRTFASTASCGLCGKTTIDAFQEQGCPIPSNSFRWSPDKIHQLPEKMLDTQPLFARTGGIHAAGLFSAGGELVRIREDIGRHNALDKLIGSALLHQQIPLTDSLIFLSGRIGFELVQKAVMAGVPVLAAVGAPSSLAVELAQEMNLTLLGFVRDQQFNVYSGSHRLDMASLAKSTHI